MASCLFKGASKNLRKLAFIGIKLADSSRLPLFIENGSSQERLNCHQTTKCLEDCDDGVKILVALLVSSEKRYSKKITGFWDVRREKTVDLFGQATNVPDIFVTNDIRSRYN
jgi:hypothetical protein